MWPSQTVKKLKILAVAYDLEWGQTPDKDGKQARRIHEALQRYADHVNDRAFEEPRPTLTQLFAADKLSRKNWTEQVGKGIAAERSIRDTTNDEKIWYTQIALGHYFKDIGHILSNKR